MYKQNFDGLMVSLSSPSEIESWSHGSVESPDTINYRTGKPKSKGLFCESIFGPVRNFECSCGKYKGVRYQGIVCEKCGVEVASSRVRRERMGHIDLASPVIHAWYRSNTSGGVHYLLGLSGHEIDRILAFVKYVCTNHTTAEERETIKKNIDTLFASKQEELDTLYKNELDKLNEGKKKDQDAKAKEYKKIYDENLAQLDTERNRLKSLASTFDFGATILESDYRNFFYQFNEVAQFKSGPDAIAQMLKKIDVEKEIKHHIETFHTIKSAEKRKKTFALIKLLVNLYISGIKPENMVLRKLPVIPPDLRPVVQLEGGRFASSDVNLFYRRVLMRNIRLKKMIQVGMPDVVKKNEIRLLQESVNNLLVGEKGSAGSRAGVKVFKSLTDMLSGKEGIFRKNLLGKRVDYSGRSVITVGPKLKLNECGIPLYIAVKMFTPFVIGKLIEEKIAYNPKQAEKLIKEEDPLALIYLQEAVKDKYVLLNRAPTLHRLSIEAFKIKLMPGKTIRLHPLVCPSFNADFDGDQMAIHLPISEQAQEEARELIAADKNILVPASGEPTITHSQDMVLGMYYLTNDEDASKEVTGRFSSIDHALEAFKRGDVDVKDTVNLLWDGDVLTTTIGRVLFNSILPKEMRFIDKTLTKKDLKRILSQIFDECGRQETVDAADAIKDLGFSYATNSSTTINVTDMIVPTEKEELIKTGEEAANTIYNFFYKGFLSENEKHRLIINTWNTIKGKIENHIREVISSGNDMHTMTTSGARGSISNTTQISGMKGLVLNQLGEIIELPIKKTYAEGLTPIEYFITAHGGRKGKADTALRTAESGYLTRKLCDSSQEVIIREEDCGTDGYIIISRDEYSDNAWDEQIYGRTVAHDVTDDHGNIIVKANDTVNKEMLKTINTAKIQSINVRSAITCHTVSGVCQKCYGYDLSRRDMVEMGTPVGIIAAQSIGEPATQLTLNTFHAGGVAGGSEEGLAQGIERIKQLFEIRNPKKPAIIAPFDGTIHFSEKNKKRIITIKSDYQKVPYFNKEGYKIVIKKGDFLKKGGAYATKGRSKLKVQEEGVILDINGDNITLGVTHEVSKVLNNLSPLKTQEGDTVYKGEVLTNGSLDIREYKDIVGDLEAQQYIIRETDKVYASQGGGVNPKHVEVVVKQMFSKIFIEDSGDSSFIPGESIKYEIFREKNEQLKQQGKRLAVGKRNALGLTTIAKETDSRLSAASFQETVRVMVEASLRGAVDELSDLKSNVIIGRLLPVGEIYRKKYNKENNISNISDADVLVDQLIDDNS